MAATYILYSKNLDRYYTGSCNDFQVRWQEHKSKKYSNSFTSKTDDWIVFLVIDQLGYAQSRRIEAYIKKMKSKVYIQNLLIYPEIIEKLKVRFG